MVFLLTTSQLNCRTDILAVKINLLLGSKATPSVPPPIGKVSTIVPLVASIITSFLSHVVNNLLVFTSMANPVGASAGGGGNGGKGFRILGDLDRDPPGRGGRDAAGIGLVGHACR